MTYYHHIIDLDKLPEDTRQAVIEVIKSHNGFALDASLNHRVLSSDLDNVTGKTPEEKQESWWAFNTLRPLAGALHKRRYRVLEIGLGGWLLLNILKLLGVDTQSILPLLEKSFGMLG